MLEPIPFAGMVEIDEFFDRTVNHMAGEYVSYNEPVAWMLMRSEVCVELTEWYGVMRGWEEFLGDNEKIVELYANPVDAVNTSEQYVDKTKNNRQDKVSSLINLTGQYKDMLSHPAKTLTDEEIEELAEYHGIDSLYETGRLDFARAILRKAQEK
jgi:hypothetical protein